MRSVGRVDLKKSKSLVRWLSLCAIRNNWKRTNPLAQQREGIKAANFCNDGEPTLKRGKQMYARNVECSHPPCFFFPPPFFFQFIRSTKAERFMETHIWRGKRIRVGEAVGFGLEPNDSVGYSWKLRNILSNASRLFHLFFFFFLFFLFRSRFRA